MPFTTDTKQNLEKIAQLESSGGLNTNHKVVDKGLNKGTSAHGKYGIMPLQVVDTVNYDKNLKLKYPDLAKADFKQDEQKIKQTLKDNPEIEKEIIESHYQRLHTKFDGDEKKIAYAWNNGITGTLNASEEEINNNPYVKKYLAASEKEAEYMEGSIEHIEEEPLGFIDVIGDAFRIDNTAYAAYKLTKRGLRELNDEFEGFDPIEQSRLDNLPLAFKDQIIYADNKREYDQIVESGRKDLESRDRLERAGWKGTLARITASIASPDILIGAGAAIRAFKASRSIVGSAAITGAIGGGTVLAGEKILQKTQVGKTDEEVATNAIAATAISFLLGGIGGAITKKLSNKTVDDLGSNVKGRVELEGKIGLDTPQTLNDMSEYGYKAEQLTKEQLGIAKSNSKLVQPILDGWVKFNKLFNPQVRLMESESKVAREFAVNMLDLSIQPQAVKEGEAISESFESVLKRKRDETVLDVGKMGEAFNSYKSSGGQLNWTKFRQEVGRSIVLGSDDNNVNKAAQVFKDMMLNKAKELKEYKLFEADLSVEEIARHINRIPLVNKLKANPKPFKDATAKYLRGQLNKIKVRLERDSLDTENGLPTSKAKAALKELESNFTGANFEKYLKQSVNHVYNNYIGVNQMAGFNRIASSNKGPLKARTFNIPDKDIIDYLETDAVYLMDRYRRSVEPLIEWRKRFGDRTIKDIGEDIIAEYDELIEANPSKASSLMKERQRILADVNMQSELVTGTYRGGLDSPDGFLRRSSQAIMAWNYMVMLGGVVVSSFTDVARAIGTRGFMNVTKKSLTPYLKGVRLTSKNLTKNEARSYGQAIETINATRTQELWGIGDPMNYGTPIERFIQTAAHKASNINLINQWNDMMQSIAVQGNRFRLVNNISDFVRDGKIDTREEEWLNFMGINKSDRVAMQDQIERFGYERTDGAIIPNVDMWENKGLRDKFVAAIGKAVDRDIITKGVSDIPAFANTNLGRLLFQFQSYAFSFNNKAIISGLQQADSRVVAEVVSMLGLGMMVYSLKQTLKGEELPEDSSKVVWAAMEQTGYTGLLSFANNYSSLFGADYRKLTGVGYNSSDQNKWAKALLGPSGGTVTKASSLTSNILTSALTDRQITQSDIHKARTLIPFQNIVYLDPLFDAVEEGASSNFPKDNRR